MTSELQLEFDVDPESHITQIADIICEQYPKANIRSVEEVIAADCGPVDYLSWLVLEGYEEHCFFYNDENPDQESLRWLFSISPTKSDLQTLKQILQQEYDDFATDDLGVLIEIPDTYLPRKLPKVNLGIYYNPITDELNTGIIADPISQQEQILEDVNKLVPAKDIETFVMNAARTLRTRLNQRAERHSLEGNVDAILKSDPHFNRETISEIPERIHPGYVDIDAELWQKPISQVEFLDGSQGFVQVWVPVPEDEIVVISLTRGEFDKDIALDQIREKFTSRIEE